MLFFLGPLIMLIATPISVFNVLRARDIDRYTAFTTLTAPASTFGWIWMVILILVD